jgi:tetrapyrrole methylase family protein/MazG family protein
VAVREFWKFSCGVLGSVARRSAKHKSKIGGKARAAKRANVRESVKMREPAVPAGFAALSEEAAKLFQGLLVLQAQLRGPEGCPWDREQNSQTLRTFLLEETHEVLDALESGDPKKFAGELGDLLLQIIFHALIASEQGLFDIRDVIQMVHSKMVRRHPHVFGDVDASTPAQVLKNWEQLKAEERRGERGAGAGAKKSAGGVGKSGEGNSLLEGVSRTIPALMEAHQLTRRAARIGFDWEKLDGILEKLNEEVGELRLAVSAGEAKRDVKSAKARVEEELGDLLFVAANMARFLEVDPEIALKGANRKFSRRFRQMEAAARAEGSKLADVPRERMEELWDEAKAEDQAKVKGA